MIKRLIKLVFKVKKANEPTKEEFLYQLSFEEQNKYCQVHNMNFHQVVNNLK